MAFRQEISGWIEENCPESCLGPGEVPGGGTKVSMTDDQQTWIERAAGEGLTVPTWPPEYGGAGFTKDQYVVFLEELDEVPLAPIEDQPRRHGFRTARLSREVVGDVFPFSITA